MAEPRVHVIDDEEDVRDSLAFLISVADLPVNAYPSAAAFLAVAHEAAGVVVTDVRMPEMDGLELVRRLASLGITLPVIVMTGHGDVLLAVEAMKAGVRDFILKPYDDTVMLDAIREALAHDVVDRGRDDLRQAYLERIGRLTPRERDVLDGLAVGKANKVIARDLDISHRTVEIYRAHVFAKMQARSLSELVRMAIVAGVT